MTNFRYLPNPFKNAMHKHLLEAKDIDPNKPFGNTAGAAGMMQMRGYIFSWN